MSENVAAVRIAEELSNSRHKLYQTKKDLEQLDRQIASAEKTIEAGRTHRVLIVANVTNAQMLHERALANYTNSPWMDIQAKPEAAPDLTNLPV